MLIIHAFITCIFEYLTFSLYFIAFDSLSFLIYLKIFFCAKTNAEKYEIRDFIGCKGHGKSEHIKQVDERCGEKCYITIDCL